MTDFDGLINASPELWLQALDADVEQGFKPLLDRVTPEDAAVQWITETMGTLLGEPADDARARSIFQRVSDEVTALLCDDPRYATDRARLSGATMASKATAVTVISVAVAHALVLPTAVVTAPVAVVLYTVGKVGRTAWCGGRHAPVGP